MLEITLLGHGGMIPLPGRYLTALMTRYRGSAILIDCGEGTQIAIREAGLGFKRIDAICFTHFHADHIAGLPGLLLTIGNSGRIEPLTLIGPKHLRRVTQCLTVIAPQLPFALEYVEIERDGIVFESEGLIVSAHKVEHRVPCYAYRLDLPRPGRFDPDKARRLEIPVRYWSVLQRGEVIELDGRSIGPDAVMGPPRQGIALCYATDLRPSKPLTKFVQGADLFVCEGMYGDPEQLDKAVERRHCLFREAAEMARGAQVSELWLTHFSPSMPNPREYLSQAADVFQNVRVDGKHTVLKFVE